MTDKNLSDAEILKAFECCFIDKPCEECPLCKEEHQEKTCLNGNVFAIPLMIIDLINRKEAKIKALQTDNAQLQSDIINNSQNYYHIKKLWEDEKEKVAKAEQKVRDVRKMLKTAKSEAYKEFAERSISKIADVMKHIERNPYDSKEETKGTICGLAHAIGRIKDLLEEMGCKE